MRALFSILTIFLGLAVSAAGQNVTMVAPPAPPDDGSLLPPAFAGWEKAKDAVRTADPSQVDAQNAALLRETGIVAAERARYARQDRKLEIRAYRFPDATSAFAAYSGMRATEPFAAEKFCVHSGSSANRILMNCTDLVLDVRYDKITAMTPAEMRSLTRQLAVATGSAALTPTATLHMPRQGISNIRFALGPAGLTHTGTLLPADIIDFSKGAELVTGNIDYAEGSALITLIKYPTFALATDRQRAIDAWAKSRPAPPAGASPSTFYTQRIGPIVAVVTGGIAEAEARTLAERIPYDVTLSQNEPVYTAKDNIGNLVVNILYLSFIVIGFAAVCGFAFGGFRILMRRLFPGRYIDSPEATELIRLDLRE